MRNRKLASTIPIRKLILNKCNFFLDTIFIEFYTFVNCKVSLAGSMSTRQRENRHNGNQESSCKEAGEEGSQKSNKEEVSKQRNRQHTRGTPKASPEVFLRGLTKVVGAHATFRRGRESHDDTQTLDCR
jgi:hypothetical protein